MLKSKKVLMAIAAITLAAGLTGCGRDNYQGTYTGYEIRSQSSTTTGGTQPTMGYNAARAVTLTLSNNGDVVTGTYQVTQSQYGGYTGGTAMTGQAESYQFTASSDQSNQLSNVMLISTSGFYSTYSNCQMQGTLSSQNRGQVVSGTLTSAAGAASNCGSLQISLTRNN